MSEYDVIVLGTGAAGLTAALTAHEGGARVGVFEKHDQVGGTTAWSGGQIWIPNNPYMADVGANDTREEALTYINSLSHGMIEPRLADAYVDAAPEMVRFLEKLDPVQFYAVAEMPDYHPEHPGGKPNGGRTIECPIYAFDELGSWETRVTPSPYYPNPHITMSETPLGKSLPTPPSDEEVARRKVHNERGCGQALIGRLLKACLDRGIEPVTSARALELIVEGGRVSGVKVEIDGKLQEVRAKQGVILATGGFEWNDEMVTAFLRGPMTHPVSIKTNTGDGLKMVQKVGAQLSNMREAWWMPAAKVPAEENYMERWLLSGPRTLPRSIMVNKEGKRFVNEAANYNAFGPAFHEIDVARFTYRNLPCWLVLDHGYIEKFGYGRNNPPGFAPDWLLRADTLRELADKLGIDPDGLEDTVARWNKTAVNAVDPDFHRGESAFDCWWGDPYNKGKPEATIGPLEKGPFYAQEVMSGALGTKGGPRCDGEARVLDLDGEPINGLYAAGNVMGSPFGMTYGGPGGTLGPAMTFGFLAGRHAAGNRHNQLAAE